MHPRLRAYIKGALLHTRAIPATRKVALEGVASFVATKRAAGEAAELIFICTHNSRRSQMAQLWAAAAAEHFGIDGVRTFSGGTEATAFNRHAVAAIERAGFLVRNPGGENPRYRVTFSDDTPALECFSKTYDDPFNAARGFAAIMTCSDADEACPLVLGAALRARLPYDDPKVADGTAEEVSQYDARCLQIASEMLYLFSQVT
jgi:protein-tyrosine-phosphatase